MEDPNMTMEEFIMIEEEKARRNSKVYNWETAMYGRIRDDDEVHNLKSFKTEFPAIVFDDTLRSHKKHAPYVDITDFEERLGMLRDRVYSLAEISGGYLRFKARGVRHRMSWRKFILALGLHTAEEMESARFGTYWAESARKIPDKGDRNAYWVGISSVGDFLGTTPSYTLIKDLMLRGMDVGSVNIPYLLARYLRLFASGRKHEAMISRVQFVARLAEHFRLLTEKRLQGLMIGSRMQRIGASRSLRLNEDVHGLRGALGEQREVLDSMARDFSRFTTWTATRLSRMMDQARVRYMSYSYYHIAYVRRIRHRTDEASTSAPQQLDP
ncbi:hypothetical protein Tco_0033403 [Tanacetum coccineum]